ncbi:alpha/beta hydrolase [Bradyrhizobium commune]|uniref:Alpha/beta hydrolase n=2 Tax=Bradyrhizobium commune TaxID=83627 RepID=A0A7S9DC38_9BRAD|nr:alpha/beta hydrolase [Bradyrhizobium commune]
MAPGAAIIERRFIATARARIHIAAAGAGRPLLLLHQTPRSWDEFREVLPRLGTRYRAIAMDTVGFGDSDALPFAENSIEAWSACAFDLLDALDLREVAVLGHHTGAAIAIEMAASRPERIAAMVLSASPYVDAERRMQKAGKPVVDEATRTADGSHLLSLWRMRQPDYPDGDIDLLERFVIDALKAGRLAAEGHHVVNRYVMEQRLPLVACPTRIIAPTADPHAFPVARKVAGAIAGASLVEIAGGMVPFPNQMPEELASAALAFLERHYPP